MRLTPLDIQQMVFKVRMRGYDCQEVKQFLEDLSQTVESLNHENSALREKLAATEEQLIALKKAETTLTHTLISTQAMADDMKGLRYDGEDDAQPRSIALPLMVHRSEPPSSSHS